MRAAKLAIAALIAIPVGALSQNQAPEPENQPPQPQATQPPATQGQSELQERERSSSCIGNITFSQEFLYRFPNAGGACRQVKVQDGQKWARFDADVVRVRGNRVTANFVDRNDRAVGSITFDAARDARIMVDRNWKRFSSLHPGDHLSFWMPESRVGFYAEPGASESTQLAVVNTGGPAQPSRR